MGAKLGNFSGLGLERYAAPGGDPGPQHHRYSLSIYGSAITGLTRGQLIGMLIDLADAVGWELKKEEGARGAT